MQGLVMTVKIQIVFYSMYGHIYKMAQAIEAGARQVKDVETEIFRVAELVPDAVLEKSGAKKIQQTFAHIPLIRPEQLTEADAILFGTPTRFGNMAAQMRNFLDQLGGLWMSGALIGKVGSVFASTGTQHGGQETTITSFHTTLLHLPLLSRARQATVNRVKMNWLSPVIRASMSLKSRAICSVAARLNVKRSRFKDKSL
jgi:NAD(P)H:quinone oxidoreductase type IV